MGRNAEAFMEQISYWWTQLAGLKDKVEYMDKMIASWDRLGKPQESGAGPVQLPTAAAQNTADTMEMLNCTGNVGFNSCPDGKK